MDTLHAYIYGTSIWYFVRGATRIANPPMVASWFNAETRPATSLELYTIRTDAYQLIALALLTLTLSGAVRLSPFSLNFSGAGKQGSSAALSSTTLGITLFHHVVTGFLAWQQWMDPATATFAMLWGFSWSGAFALLGAAALAVGGVEQGGARKGSARKLR